MSFKKPTNWKLIALAFLWCSIITSIVSYILVMVIGFSLSPGWEVSGTLGMWQWQGYYHDEYYRAFFYGYYWILSSTAIVLIVFVSLSAILFILGFVFCIKANIKISGRWKISIVSWFVLSALALTFVLIAKPNFDVLEPFTRKSDAFGNFWIQMSEYSSSYTIPGVVIVTVLSLLTLFPMIYSGLALRKDTYKEIITIL